MQIDEIGGSKGLPQRDIMGRETQMMLGDPTLSVITDPYQKGIRGFDAQKVYRMRRQVA